MKDPEAIVPTWTSKDWIVGPFLVGGGKSPLHFYLPDDCAEAAKIILDRHQELVASGWPPQSSC